MSRARKRKLVEVCPVCHKDYEHCDGYGILSRCKEAHGIEICEHCGEIITNEGEGTGIDRWVSSDEYCEESPNEQHEPE